MGIENKQKTWLSSSSGENIFSKALINVMGLSTKKYPTPYRIRWIKKRTETRVTKVCRVPFSIRMIYKSNVVCDVVDMEACHLLLERP